MSDPFLKRFRNCFPSSSNDSRESTVSRFTAGVNGWMVSVLDVYIRAQLLPRLSWKCRTHWLQIWYNFDLPWTKLSVNHIPECLKSLNVHLISREKNNIYMCVHYRVNALWTRLRCQTTDDSPDPSKEKNKITTRHPRFSPNLPTTTTFKKKTPTNKHFTIETPHETKPKHESRPPSNTFQTSRAIDNNSSSGDRGDAATPTPENRTRFEFFFWEVL